MDVRMTDSIHNNQPTRSPKKNKKKRFLSSPWAWAWTGDEWVDISSTRTQQKKNLFR